MVNGGVRFNFKMPSHREPGRKPFREKEHYSMNFSITLSAPIRGIMRTST